MQVGGKDSGFMGEINVTPFVDVMLVLLIIFMVTAPMMVEGVNVDLPETTAQPLESEKEPLVVTIDKEGQVFINDFKTGRDIFNACEAQDTKLGAHHFGLMDENFCKNETQARELLAEMEKEEKAYSFY